MTMSLTHHSNQASCYSHHCTLWLTGKHWAFGLLE